MKQARRLNKQPRLTLVGAGPGDPDLMTLKAIRALKAADIVLYDALVSEEILAFIPEQIPSVPVGKRAGKHSLSQERINELIVESAFLYGHVVRLKGGDPLVFGRAQEEIEAAGKHGIPTEIVPGISSALSVPAAADIPLTARGVSESFWVVTGTTKSGTVSNDLRLAAQSSATVIILMGLHKLEEIMHTFSLYGKGKTPVAVLENGTRSDQKIFVGEVSNISAKIRAEAISGPSIIVVGEVVAQRNRWKEVQSQLALHAVA